MNKTERLKACLAGGIIGDAIGAQFENSKNASLETLSDDWFVTDDSQLTLATCEAIADQKNISAERVASKFLEWFNKGLITHMGSSTLKSLRDLQMGAHWALAGRSGEHAAGNGAAMRIAPLAFKETVTSAVIKDVCSITHKNDEAYAAALAVYFSCKHAIEGNDPQDLVEVVVPKLFDSHTRDRLDKILEEKPTLEEWGKKHFPTGFAPDSVPFALLAASLSNKMSFEQIMQEIIKTGGDTDTVGSIFGQVAGTYQGISYIPQKWIKTYEELWIANRVNPVVLGWK